MLLDCLLRLHKFQILVSSLIIIIYTYRPLLTRIGFYVSFYFCTFNAGVASNPNSVAKITIHSTLFEEIIFVDFQKLSISCISNWQCLLIKLNYYWSMLLCGFEWNICLKYNCNYRYYKNSSIIHKYIDHLFRVRVYARLHNRVLNSW